MMRQNSSGIAHLSLIMLVVLIGIGVVDYSLYKNGQIKPISFQKQTAVPFAPTEAMATDG